MREKPKPRRRRWWRRWRRRFYSYWYKEMSHHLLSDIICEPVLCWRKTKSSN
jgi:hypothetical protein